jgi:hypothetical protein
VRVSTKSIASAVAALGLTVAAAAGGQAATSPDPSPEPVVASAATQAGDNTGAQPAVNYPACAVNITPEGVKGWVIQIPTKTASYAAESRRCLLSTANSSSDLVGTYRLQTALRKCYARSIVATNGYFNADTRSTVISVQAQLNIYPQDGVYGPTTHNFMEFYGSQGQCDWDKVIVS